MTFLERYNQETTWQGKATVMGLYHLAMKQRHKSWTITLTAEYFGVSIGLVSENIQLADAMHKWEIIGKQRTRNEALRCLAGRPRYNG